MRSAEISGLEEIEEQARLEKQAKKRERAERRGKHIEETPTADAEQSAEKKEKGSSALMTGIMIVAVVLAVFLSVTLFVAPITFAGFTALSVEMLTKRLTPKSIAVFATLYVPKMLFLTASFGLSSISGTCLCAAAWKTTVGLNSSKTSTNLFSSRIEPILI